MIPISVVRLDEAAERLAVEVIRWGILAQGPTVAGFERECAELIGVKHAVALNNCAVALAVAHEVLDVQPNDRPTHQGAHAGPPLRAARRHEPHRAAARPRACGGHRRVARRDLGRARRAGSFGLGTFSLCARENLTSGDGGMITTLADRLPVWRNQGDKGVDCGLRYPRTVNDYECYRHYPRVVADPARVTERVVRRCVSLPVHQHLSDGDVKRIVEVAPEAVGA